MKDYISLNIKQIMSIKKLTQDELGEKLDLKRGAIGSYINEKAKPKIETIQKISVLFNISIDDFINRDISNTSKHDGARAANKNRTNKDLNIYILEQNLNESEKFGMALQEEVNGLKALVQNKDELMDVLKELVEAKDKLITSYEQQLNTPGTSKQQAG